MMVYTIFKSPVGELLLTGDDSAITGLYFADKKHAPAAATDWTRAAKHPLLVRAADQLDDYFSGQRKAFDLPLRSAGTEFQKRIWHEIARIPFGETLTYSNLADRAGSPAAVRAAGASTGRNPISIIVPCHRVVGKNGAMTGFAGGVERKVFLLDLERRIDERTA